MYHKRKSKQTYTAKHCTQQAKTHVISCKIGIWCIDDVIEHERHILKTFFFLYAHYNATCKETCYEM